MVCGTNSTWASVQDLYDRYGEEYIDKKCIRNKYNVLLQEYVADETQASILKVLELALCDAKNLLLAKLSCIYGNTNLLDLYAFGAIKTWHMKITIATLDAGGDCSSCSEALDLKNFVECGNMCTDDGICLTKNSTFFSVSEPSWPCECLGSCGCCG